MCKALFTKKYDETKYLQTIQTKNVPDYNNVLYLKKLKFTTVLEFGVDKINTFIQQRHILFIQV